MDQLKVKNILKEWERSVLAQDVDTLMKLYSAKAVLKPTLSNSIRSTPDDIKLYFVGGEKYSDVGFLNNGFVSISWGESFCVDLGESCVQQGVYSFKNEFGELTKAHYMFVFSSAFPPGDDIEICAHHSSLFI